MDEHVGCGQQAPFLGPRGWSSEEDGLQDPETTGNSFKPVLPTSPVRSNQNERGVVPAGVLKLGPTLHEQVQTLLFGIESAQVQKDSAVAEGGKSSPQNSGIEELGHFSRVDAVRGYGKTVVDPVLQCALDVEMADRMQKRCLVQIPTLKQSREGRLRDPTTTLSLHGEATVQGYAVRYPG